MLMTLNFPIRQKRTDPVPVNLGGYRALKTVDRNTTRHWPFTSFPQVRCSDPIMVEADSDCKPRVANTIRSFGIVTVLRNQYFWRPWYPSSGFQQTLSELS